MFFHNFLGNTCKKFTRIMTTMEFMGKKVKAYEIKSSIDIHSAMDEIARF